MSENKFDFNSLANVGISNYLKDTDILSRQMQNLNIPQPDYSKLTFPAQEHNKEEKMYWEESLNLLKSIETNTANLATLVDLISSNNEKQDEIISIITDLFNIAKETNKEEALSKYRKVMNRINDFAGDADLLIKLSNYGASIGMILKSQGIL